MKIGLRIPGACGKEPLEEFARWCKGDGFDVIDLSGVDAGRAATVRAAGLEVGTFDLPGTGLLLSPDPAERVRGIDTAGAAVNAIADAGGDKAFCVFVPQNAAQSRRDSFENWKQAFPQVVQEAEKRGVRIAVEGWPGPNNSALGVTPEQLRAMLGSVTSESFGVNYDPSHLVRIGVDYKRTLNEFAYRVVHAHGKDTALDGEGAYLYGNIGPSFDRAVPFGGGNWRYTVPGEGVVDWGYVCGRLQQAGFDGTVSVELEDFRYNGSVESERKGLSRARAYLSLYV
jgi:sugar phosphate isomerase/epimerase